MTMVYDDFACEMKQVFHEQRSGEQDPAITCRPSKTFHCCCGQEKAMEQLHTTRTIPAKKESSEASNKNDTKEKEGKKNAFSFICSSPISNEQLTSVAPQHCQKCTSIGDPEGTHRGLSNGKKSGNLIQEQDVH